MTNILFAGPDHNWAEFEAPLNDALADLNVTLTRDPANPEQFDYIIYSPSGPINDFTPFTNVKAILSLWAGVETIVTNQTITAPLARMVEPGLSKGMAEFVTGHALRTHLLMPTYLQDGTWREDIIPPLASSRRIGFLGVGALGQSAAAMCRSVGFQTLGWSRRLKSIDGMTCYAGDDGMAEMLAQTDILVTLLPLTAQTTHMINTKTLAALPKGAALINPGRGPLIDDDALIAALESGHIAHATLDVFATEPLPKDHPYWAHRSVFVTPHIAASTRADTGAAAIAANIRGHLNGEPLRNLVDRTVGY